VTATATPTFTPTATPTPVADLSLDKVGVEGTDLSDPCTFVACFTVTVTNNGPNMATNVTVKDFPTGGYSFHGSADVPPTTASKGTFDPSTNVWTVGSLANGEIATLQLRANFFFPSAPPFIQTNCAEVLHSDQFDPNSTPNNGSTTEDDDACASVSLPS